MCKRLTKPFEKNVRLDAPLGLLGVPPDAAMLGGDTYIIVTNRKTAERVINEIIFDKNTETLLQ